MIVTTLLLLTACTGGSTTVEPSSSPSESAPAPASEDVPAPPALSSGDEPSPTDWLSALESDGTTLWVTAHRCPGQVQRGQCTFLRDFTTRIGPLPVGLWRYAGGRWTGLGRPGVTSDAVMRALPGGLLFLRSSEYTTMRPLRVSVDEGRSWQDWPIPDTDLRCVPNSTQAEFGPCTVVVAGSYVVVASSYGWIRRGIHSDRWEDISPPRRSPDRSGAFGYGYGVLALADGTLVATVNPLVNGEGGGRFLVLREGASTWSAPRLNPGESSQLVAVEGSTVFATCWKPSTGVVNVVDATSCGEYRTTDLQHWTRTLLPPGAEAEHGVACERRWTPPNPVLRETAVSLRVGSVVYSITRALVTREDEIHPRALRTLDELHLVRHVLERSSDDCRTWTDVLG